LQSVVEQIIFIDKFNYFFAIIIVASREPAAAVGARLAETRVINVMDQEEDIYDILARARELEQPVLIRIAWNSRVKLIKWKLRNVRVKVANLDPRVRR
jgi:hypothetical protein